MTGTPWTIWLFPLALILHNLEEAVLLPPWSPTAGRFHRPVGTLEFGFAVAVITALGVAITAVYALTGPQGIACYLFYAFNFGMLLNVFVPHLAATIVLRRYCPGLLTGLLGILPVTAGLLAYGYERGYYSFPKFWLIAVPFSALVVYSITPLFRLGRFLEKQRRRS